MPLLVIILFVAILLFSKFFYLKYKSNNKTSHFLTNFKDYERELKDYLVSCVKNHLYLPQTFKEEERFFKYYANNRRVLNIVENASLGFLLSLIKGQFFQDLNKKRTFFLEKDFIDSLNEKDLVYLFFLKKEQYQEHYNFLMLPHFQNCWLLTYQGPEFFCKIMGRRFAEAFLNNPQLDDWVANQDFHDFIDKGP